MARVGPEKPAVRPILMGGGFSPAARQGGAAKWKSPAIIRAAQANVRNLPAIIPILWLDFAGFFI